MNALDHVIVKSIMNFARNTAIPKRDLDHIRDCINIRIQHNKIDILSPVPTNNGRVRTTGNILAYLALISLQLTPENINDPKARECFAEIASAWLKHFNNTINETEKKALSK